VGDLAADTEVFGRDGAYERFLSRDWEIWGPNGGYVASVALRAAGAHSRFDRPASIVGHYLGVASFDDPVELTTTTLRATKRVESIRVSMCQRDQPIFEALVWAVGDVDGLEHDATEMPTAPEPTDLLSVQERLRDVAENMYHRFWRNFDERPLTWIDNWEARDRQAPNFASWFRYLPVDTFADQWADACRSLILVDTLPWPAANRYYVNDHGYIAPSIDIAVEFHRFRAEEPWLLAQASARSAHAGLLGGHVDVWARTGELLASGVSQMLFRPMRA
jgi:acyl-CoA thioesterase-2